MRKDIITKREREKQIVSQMIALYCKRKHGNRKGLCVQCEELEAYAKIRSDKCPFMETKTFCSNCRVHWCRTWRGGCSFAVITGISVFNAGGVLLCQKLSILLIFVVIVMEKVYYIA